MSDPDTAAAIYDWRLAARSTDQRCALTDVDLALTATGLAAEIHDCTQQLRRLT